MNPTASDYESVPDLWSGDLGRRLGLPPVERVVDGRYVAQVDVDSAVLGPRETAFGGWLACLIDHVAGAATAVHMGPTAGFLTARLYIDFRHPIRRGTVTLTASLKSVGGRLTDVSVLVEQHGVQCCHAQLTQVAIRGSRCELR